MTRASWFWAFLRQRSFGGAVLFLHCAFHSTTSTNDQALDVEAVSTNVVKVTPRKVGTSEIQVQVSRDVRFYLTIEVFDPQEATDLGLAAGSPEKK